MSHKWPVDAIEIVPGWHLCRSTHGKETHNLESRGGFSVCKNCQGILFDENYPNYVSLMDKEFKK